MVALALAFQPKVIGYGGAKEFEAVHYLDTLAIN